MREKVDYFTADYRDGRVHIGGKVYQTGYFATHLLNQFYENDTAARIAVFTTDNWHLEQGINPYTLVNHLFSAVPEKDGKYIIPFAIPSRHSPPNCFTSADLVVCRSEHITLPVSYPF